MEVPATQTVRTLRPLFFKSIQLETGTLQIQILYLAISSINVPQKL